MPSKDFEKSCQEGKAISFAQTRDLCACPSALAALRYAADPDWSWGTALLGAYFLLHTVVLGRRRARATTVRVR